ncbi:MFS transporter [uncultured Jatrophihabitans sp.]|uniref:MFS transporter n=1 Tax=uncultured Jatrophihabitans sp. TaxID=1610747 RepID=UPI0035CC750A
MAADRELVDGAVDRDLVLRSARGHGVLAATILGSGLASLDGTVVNVALPRIGRDLHAGLVALQWTVNAYTLTLAGFLLLGGALGDRRGRRRIFLLGVVWFTAASVGCALAPTAGVLIGMRALQGVGAALLTPGSLAILEAVFRPEDRAAAVGSWSGLGGVATAIGPVLGGVLVGVAPWGWRLVFLLNVPLAAAVIWLSIRFVPETRDEEATGRLDLPGVVLAAAGLALLVYALTEGPQRGWSGGMIACLLGGLALLAAFLLGESRSGNPLMPLSLFRDREFAAANIVTLAVYAALSAALFLIPLQLQRVSGYSPVAAGTALLPVTAVMLLLSARAGRLAQQIGPRIPMTVGPIIAAVGLAMLTRVGRDASYLTDLLPAVLVFALGLSATVAPLTATALASAPAHQVGVASAVNNDVARVAGLLSVAVLPGLAGISAKAYADPAALSSGFHTAALIAAGLCASGGVLAALLIRGKGDTALPTGPDLRTGPAAASGDGPGPESGSVPRELAPVTAPRPTSSCAISAPPARP